MRRILSKLSVGSGRYAGFPRMGLLVVGLSACGGGSADVSGTVNEIAFGSSKFVYFGGPFVAVSNVKVDCEQLAFVRQSYESGSQPTTDEMQLVQFSYDAGSVAAGNASISISGPVKAMVVKSDETHFEFTTAESGSINVEDYEDEQTATGTFTAVTFEDGGVLDGDFDAEWCRNLRDR